MPTTVIDVRDLPGKLDEALALASAGTEVVLTDGPATRGRLVPVVQPSAARRVANLHRGMMTVSADFDAPLGDEFWAGQGCSCCPTRTHSSGGTATRGSCRDSLGGAP
jgi:antitoxin (DNA-binding transcriptional repressor) of toxin-antitoxin stability system